MLPFGIGFKKQAKIMAIARFLTAIRSQTAQTVMNNIGTQSARMLHFPNWPTLCRKNRTFLGKLEISRRFLATF